jgi:hypothetical protein
MRRSPALGPSPASGAISRGASCATPHEPAAGWPHTCSPSLAWQGRCILGRRPRHAPAGCIADTRPKSRARASAGGRARGSTLPGRQSYTHASNASSAPHNAHRTQQTDDRGQRGGLIGWVDRGAQLGQCKRALAVWSRAQEAALESSQVIRTGSRARGRHRRRHQRRSDPSIACPPSPRARTTSGRRVHSSRTRPGARARVASTAWQQTVTA